MTFLERFKENRNRLTARLCKTVKLASPFSYNDTYNSSRLYNHVKMKLFYFIVLYIFDQIDNSLL